MNRLNIESYKNYSEDIKTLIVELTNSDKRTNEIMNSLKVYIENDTAIISGHIMNDKLVSFIWCYPREFGAKKRLHISYFIVDKLYRGKGYSKDLLKFAKCTALELGINEIDLNVDPTNSKAIRVYEAAGFETEKLLLVLKNENGDINV